MRAPTTTLAILTCAACANTAEPLVPYDEVAQTLGADVATDAGGDVTALADAVMLAHGGMIPSFARDEAGIVRGTHDGINYLYVITCYDADGKRLDACGETTATANAIGVWAGVLHAPRFEAAMRHEGVWTLHGIHTPQSWATGMSWSGYEVTFGPATSDATSYYVTANKTGTVILDLDHLAVAAGTMQYAAQTGDNVLDATVVFDRPPRATIAIDDRVYWLDTTTGDVAIATTGSLY